MVISAGVVAATAPAARVPSRITTVACGRREIRAFEQVYLTHGVRLKSIAHHILRNRQDAEDAVQETFLKLYRGIEGFQGQSSIGTWLCRIVINVSYDLARKRQREPD